MFAAVSSSLRGVPRADCIFSSRSMSSLLTQGDNVHWRPRCGAQIWLMCVLRVDSSEVMTNACASAKDTLHASRGGSARYVERRWRPTDIGAMLDPSALAWARHASSHVTCGGKTRHATPELGTHGMRGSKPAGFSGVGERAARSLDRVSRRRGPRRAAGASLEQRDLLDDVRRVREHSRGHDAGEVVGEVVRRMEAAVGGAVAPALPA